MPVRAAHVQVLRFGDAYADDYDWQQGCLYDPTHPHPDCYNKAGQGSPLDQFLAFAGQVGAQPLIVVNGEIDDPQQAAQLVAFYWQHCTHAAGRQCLDPYWEIGDSPATWSHFAIPLKQRRPSDASMITPDQYAALVTSYRAAMAKAAPTTTATAPDQDRGRRVHHRRHRRKLDRLPGVRWDRHTKLAPPLLSTWADVLSGVPQVQCLVQPYLSAT